MDYALFTFNQGQWDTPLDTTLDSTQTFVFFVSNQTSENLQDPVNTLCQAFSNSVILGLSTVASIINDQINPQDFYALVIRFDYTPLKLIYKDASNTDMFTLGTELAEALKKDDLAHIFLCTSSVSLNNTILAYAFNSSKKPVSISGGVASAKDKQRSWVYANNHFSHTAVVSVGFYGKHIQFGLGHATGLERLGITRCVTRSKGREIFSLDGKPALSLYKKYLNTDKKTLKYNDFIFPIAIFNSEGNIAKIRSVFAYNDARNSLIINDEISNHTQISFMNANFNKLTQGAYDAAEQATRFYDASQKVVALAISCTGRYSVLSEHIEEELFSVKEGLPEDCLCVGFYSDGEINAASHQNCTLHNQTMTLSLIWELENA